MTFEVQTAPGAEAATPIFDFSRRAPAAAVAPPAGGRPDPEPGWATRNPDRAMLFLFLTPRDCTALDELLAL